MCSAPRMNGTAACFHYRQAANTEMVSRTTGSRSRLFHRDNIASNEEKGVLGGQKPLSYDHGLWPFETSPYPTKS